jgi:polysaccharide export outer membrane protein
MTGSSLDRRVAAALAGVLALAVLAGCGGPRMIASRSEFIPFTAEQKVENEAHVTRAYRIQEGDLLKVHFAYQKELNQDGVVVLSDGSINLLGIDRVRVAGLSVAEADSIITLRYAKEYREPALSVMIQETSGRRVYVMGEVRNPGFYRLPTGGMDVLGAIGMASGFSEDAVRDGTIIARMTRDGYQVREVNLKDFSSSDFVAGATAPLESYDIVYVPRNRVGDLAYFSKTVLSTIGSVTRVLYDLTYIVNGTWPGSER